MARPPRAARQKPGEAVARTRRTASHDHARAGGACPRRFRLLPVVAAGVEAQHVIVWAGMRGVVTLAAAQTDPRSVEDRPVLIYIAFVVALVSLMLQGFTLPWLSNRLMLDAPGEGADDAAEQERLAGELREAAGWRASPPPTCGGATAARSSPS